MENEFIRLAVASLGGPTAVAKLRGVSAWAVSKWVKDGMPSAQVLWLSEQCDWKFTPHQLAPEIYPHGDDGLPSDVRGLSMEERFARVPQQVAQDEARAYDGPDRRRQMC